MPEEDPPEPSCEQGCVLIHKAATDAAWAAYQASPKAPSDVAAYLTAVNAAAAALNGCLENCPGDPPPH